MKKQSDRYLKIVEWSEEDGCYVGSCPGLMYGGVHGNDEAKVYKELCQAVEEVLALYEEDGKPLPDATAGKTYSGRFILRVRPELHKALSIKALQENESLNTLCERSLAAAIGVDDLPQASAPRRAARASTSPRKIRVRS